MPNQIDPCPVCGWENTRIVKVFSSSWDHLLKDYFNTKKPEWKIEQGLCTHCLDQVQSHYVALAAEGFRGDGSPGEVHGYKVMPIASRLLSHPDLTGKGVTICFIDSGFFPHPDLVYPVYRIRYWENMANAGKKPSFSDQPEARHWHGTMTAVVAAGSGYLSGGFYSGIARNADLVLLSVADSKGQIRGKAIAEALNWVVENHRQYDIRIVNISVSSDYPLSDSKSPVSQAVHMLRKEGVMVVAAAGNQPGSPLYPPASSPSALTVGGLDDRNTIPMDDVLYPSSYGFTTDQYLKPEIIAPAIWLAAPILPGTAQQEEAAALFNVWHARDWHIKTVLANRLHKLKVEESILDYSPDEIRDAIHDRITKAKYISPHYKHVDGTSFAAPIVASIIAQMLEANPDLSPADIRELLIRTARPLRDVSTYQQGYGIIQPLKAVGSAQGDDLTPYPHFSPVIDYEKKQIKFHYRSPESERVALSGNFNNWSTEGIAMTRNGNGQWWVKIDMLPKGAYQYKFIENGNYWVPDPRNIYRVPDGHEGFNSKFEIVEQVR